MRFDNFIQSLLPHDDKFFVFFEKSVHNLQQATKLLQDIACASQNDRVALVDQMNELEHVGDSITHEIFSALNSTFITPIDREDIHVLTSALDDIMDFMDGSANRFVLYKIDQCPDDMKRLINILDHSVTELEKGIVLLKDLKHHDPIYQVLRQVHSYENEADTVFETAIAKLFDEESNPVQIIKLKEIYVSLETATDKCEDVANVLETILIKHA